MNRKEDSRIIVRCKDSDADDVVVDIPHRAFAGLRRFAEKRGIGIADVVRACIAPRPGRNAAYARRAFFQLAEWELDGVARIAEHDGTTLGDVCARGVRYYLITRGITPPPKFAFALSAIRMDRIDGEIDSGATFPILPHPSAPDGAKCAKPNENKPKYPSGGFLRRVSAWILGLSAQCGN